jgi:hypothetical protein
VSGNSGTYPTLVACQDVCKSYNCVDGSCVQISGSGGEYPSLIACSEGCTPVVSYDCVSQNCVEVQGSGGSYPTLAACQDAFCQCPPAGTTEIRCTIGGPDCGGGYQEAIWEADGACGWYFQQWAANCC